MLMKSVLAAAVLAFAVPAFAEGVVVVDPYVRVSGPTAKSGAAFMVIENHTAADDRLIKVASDVAERVEMHTHKADAQGNMQMLEVPEGFLVPAHASHALERGGDHVMFLGLKRGLANGDKVAVTLTFEKAGDVMVEIPVDSARKPQAGAHGGHGAHMPGHKAP
ncbi:MAG: copper chaperone PCu(A)C [Gemmobacter sp.]|nr:copper chaperone PCu(A)C [Gemmobacter sp.]